jgi:ribonuclease P/MRP protein subunit RPP40
LDKYFPIAVTVSPEQTGGIKVKLPPLKPPEDAEISGYSENFEDFVVETQEWLSLISLNSPRIDADDHIDPFLSRYVSPGDSTTTSNLVKLTWRGFFSPEWAHKMFVQAVLAIPRKTWFVFSVGGFGESWSGGTKGCTILRVPNASTEYVLWEVAQ